HAVYQLRSREPSLAKLSTLSLHDALPISKRRLESAVPQTVGPSYKRDQFAASGNRALYGCRLRSQLYRKPYASAQCARAADDSRSEEHTSELQSRSDIVCRLLLEKKKRRA